LCCHRYTIRYTLPYISTGLVPTGAAKNNTLDLTFATQNCNSLNLTTNVKNFELKIAAIKGLNTDIIFLCDTRMVSNKGVNSINRVKQAFRDFKGKKYKVYANSTKNSRGVAILISFEKDIEVTDTCTDPEENYIFLRVNYNGQKLLLGSIYGHNSTSRDFYRRITRIISKNQDRKLIMGGDWNTVWDRNPVATNIDTFQMANIPNQKIWNYWKIWQVSWACLIPIECYTLINAILPIHPLDILG